MQQSKSNYKEERVDFIIGVAVVVAVLALFGWLLWRVSKSFKNYSATLTSGEIRVSGEAVRGKEQIFTYLPSEEIAEGTHTVWKVDDKIVFEGAYTKDSPPTLYYTPESAGRHRITATAGAYTQTYIADVAAPRLTLTAPDLTIVYGEELPQLLCTVDGFVGNDEEACEFDRHCVVDGGKLNVGVYRIKSRECDYLDYETDYVDGTLTVLPRQLAVNNDFVKIYDGTNRLNNPDIHVDGVLPGDDICVNCDVLYFDNKNAGSKTVVLSTACLEGEDAANYTLHDFACGTILPKELRIEGITVKDKLYDGTTKAVIDKMGTIVGVCEGDVVAIGSVTTAFDGAEAGKHNVTVNNITLVGADKDNYLLTNVDCLQAEIQSNESLWERLLHKEPLAPTM